jgi:hypothetical protein
MSGRIGTFAEFWPFYVSQHRRHGTRVMHFAGTTLGLLWFAAAAVGPPGNGLFLLYGLVNAYGFAWIGHYFIEKNRPATFTYPLWSLLGDFKMYGLMWRGKMKAEAERLGLVPSGVAKQEASIPLSPREREG